MVSKKLSYTEQVKTNRDENGFMLLNGQKKRSNTKTRKSQEEEYQEDSLEKMYMFQAYHGINKEKQYVLRGSKLHCEFESKDVLLDCITDYGIYKGELPVLTCGDCKEENIHTFGSCKCPESYYRGRVAETTDHFPDGTPAEKSAGNEKAHICLPMINEEQGWMQTDTGLHIAVGGKNYTSIS